MTQGATDVTMPQMGADMEEGTLLRWLKHPGDHVDRGEPIAEIETDKANIEIEAFEEGVLQETLVEEGQVVPVGGVIARIGHGDGAATSGSTAPLQPAQPPQKPEQPQQSDSRLESRPAQGESRFAGSAEEGQPATAVSAAPHSASRPETKEPSSSTLQRLRISPVARKIAAQLGIDATSLRGSGPDGRIVRKDVERANAEQGTASHVAAGAETQPKRWVDDALAGSPEVEAAPRPAAPAEPARISESLAPQATTQPGVQDQVQQAAATAPQTRAASPTTQPRAEAPSPPVAPTDGLVPLSRMRQAIARRMTQSKREAPHYYVTGEIDMTEAMSFRSSVNEAGGDDAHVSVNDLIVKACAEVLRRYPHFNASFIDNGLRMNERINVCIAVSLPDGLIAPALLDVGGKSLGAIAREAKDLADRARNGGLKGPELNDGTFTVSNLGMYGIETLIPIIQPPQSAILGVGAVQDKPAVRNGQIVVRKLMMVALAADHRVTDGAQGAEFLRELQHFLEQPVSLAL
jgi:pyruvate dehydrogenase E2 component (dihydrolipoamide acetyltransferase)